MGFWRGNQFPVNENEREEASVLVAESVRPSVRLWSTIDPFSNLLMRYFSVFGQGSRIFT